MDKFKNSSSVPLKAESFSVVFSILGFMAEEAGVKVADVVRSGNIYSRSKATLIAV